MTWTRIVALASAQFKVNTAFRLRVTGKLPLEGFAPDQSPLAVQLCALDDQYSVIGLPAVTTPLLVVRDIEAGGGGDPPLLPPPHPEIQTASVTDTRQRLIFKRS